MTLRQLIVSALLLTSAAWTHALEILPYSAATLAAAQKADKPVALRFSEGLGRTFAQLSRPGALTVAALEEDAPIWLDG
jgi:methionine-rich copper-binding protein CopC